MQDQTSFTKPFDGDEDEAAWEDINAFNEGATMAYLCRSNTSGSNATHNDELSSSSRDVVSLCKERETTQFTFLAENTQSADDYQQPSPTMVMESSSIVAAVLDMSHSHRLVVSRSDSDDVAEADSTTCSSSLQEEEALPALVSNRYVSNKILEKTESLTQLFSRALASDHHHTAATSSIADGGESFVEDGHHHHPRQQSELVTARLAWIENWMDGRGNISSNGDADVHDDNDATEILPSVTSRKTPTAESSEKVANKTHSVGTTTMRRTTSDFVANRCQWIKSLNHDQANAGRAWQYLEERRQERKQHHSGTTGHVALPANGNVEAESTAASLLPNDEAPTSSTIKGASGSFAARRAIFSQQEHPSTSNGLRSPALAKSKEGSPPRDKNVTFCVDDPRKKDAEEVYQNDSIMKELEEEGLIPGFLLKRVPWLFGLGSKGEKKQPSNHSDRPTASKSDQYERLRLDFFQQDNRIATPPCMQREKSKEESESPHSFGSTDQEDDEDEIPLTPMHQFYCASPLTSPFTPPPSQRGSPRSKRHN